MKFIVEKTRDSYAAFAEKYPVYTVAGDWMELQAMMLDAINLHFSEEGVVIKPEQIRVQLNLAQFFEFYKVINAKGFERAHRYESKPACAVHKGN